MAQTGKKINELTAITTVSDETVLPAVYVSGGNASSTANKVSIEQISNKITNDLSTILNSKQDKLTAGDNITIESNVISATDTKYTAGTNITISEQNVISADVDALPSQTGQSGKFLTTDGTDASWAEVNIPNNVWTQDNLVAGTNISITQVVKPVIDENTTALWHLDESLDSALRGGDVFWNQTTSYVSGKFAKGLYCSTGGYISGINFPIYTKQQDFTIDFWVHILSGQTQFGIGISGDSSAGEIYFDQGRLIIRTPDQVYQVEYPSGTDIYDWTHCAIVNDFSNTKTYWFINGKKVFELASNHYYLKNNSRLYYYGCLDELRVSNVARWTSDFTPYSQPYGPAGGATQYQINAIVPQGGSAPTLTWYTGNTGTTVTIADTTSASLVKVYKNGILLQPTEDYSISGTTLTLVTALESQDKITTEVFA